MSYIRDQIKFLRELHLNDAADTVEKLLEVCEASDVLYKQLHNIKEVRPRWANESVCKAMVAVGNSIAALDK